MQQQISIITIGVADLARSKHFYGEGFGWSPVFENEEIIFFQMNGLMLGCFLKPSLEADMGRPLLAVAGAYSLAHNVESEAAVIAVMNRLAQAGGRINITRGIEHADPKGGPADDHAVRALWKGWREYMGADASAGAA